LRNDLPKPVNTVTHTSVTTATPSYAGYWRIGYDNTTGATNYFFKGNLASAAEYPYALSPAQVAAHDRAGT
jgi:hypothetical protein